MAYKALRRSDFLQCPHRILTVDHYRDDGSCKCDEGGSMTMLIRGFSQVETRSDNGIEAHMTPGGGTMTLRTRDVTIVASTRDMLHSLLGVAHPTIKDVQELIDLVIDDENYNAELLETLHVFKANLTACLRETDEGSYR